MSQLETRTAAIAVRMEPVRAWTADLYQSTADFVAPIGTWAAGTAQRWGATLSVLLGPAVFTAYVFTIWSLAGNLGWTSTFLFSSGPWSNWLVWLGFAIALNLSANILKRCASSEPSNQAE